MQIKLKTFSIILNPYVIFPPFYNIFPESNKMDMMDLICNAMYVLKRTKDQLFFLLPLGIHVMVVYIMAMMMIVSIISHIHDTKWTKKRCTQGFIAINTPYTQFVSKTPGIYTHIIQWMGLIKAKAKGSCIKSTWCPNHTTQYVVMLWAFFSFFFSSTSSASIYSGRTSLG